jgi:ABC-type transport system substrate-binding protein
MTARRPRRSVRTRAGGALAVLVVLVGSAGCSTSGSSTEAQVPDPLAIDDESAITRGGRIVIGLNAESNGWSPVADQWTLPAHMAASTFYESLMAVGPDGSVQPQLAEGMTHNDDFTEWQIRLRPGVRFHDGTPFDAAAVKANLDASKAGVGGIALRAIDTVTVTDPSTVTVTMKSPWATFPSTLAGQQGYMAAPASLEAKTASTKPVGTGPFEFVDWMPDRRLVVARNDDYWVEGVPYLDEIEFQPIRDPLTRKTALVTDALDIIYISSPEDVRDLQDSNDYTVVTDSLADETFAVLNSGQPPFDELATRQALAQATDKQRVVDVLGAGIVETADSPFSPNEPWYTADTREVGLDPDAARATVARLQAQSGEPVSFRVITTPDQPSVNRAELMAQIWAEVGFEPEIVSLEQGQFVKALTNGDFESRSSATSATPTPTSTTCSGTPR